MLSPCSRSWGCLKCRGLWLTSARCGQRSSARVWWLPAGSRWETSSSTLCSAERGGSGSAGRARLLSLPGCWAEVPQPLPASAPRRCFPASAQILIFFFQTFLKGTAKPGTTAQHALRQHCWNSLPPASKIRCAGVGSWAAKPGRGWEMPLSWQASVPLPCLETPAPRRCPSALPADLLQVLLSLLLALAALHGGLASPPPADAQPEEQRLQLKRPPRLGGCRRRRRKSFC